MRTASSTFLAYPITVLCYTAARGAVLSGTTAKHSGQLAGRVLLRTPPPAATTYDRRSSSATLSRPYSNSQSAANTPSSAQPTTPSGCVDGTSTAISGSATRRTRTHLFTYPLQPPTSMLATLPLSYLQTMLQTIHEYIIHYFAGVLSI